jgi:hypothetical protein
MAKGAAGWQKECDIMKEDRREFLGMNQLGDIWSEAYIDWVENWTHTYGKEGKTQDVTIFWTLHSPESNATGNKYLAVGAVDVQDFTA